MDKTCVKLTAAEIGALWSQYMNDSLAAAVMKHFLTVVEDVDVKELLQLAAQTAARNQKEITEIFKQEKFALPVAFTDDDVNLDAPRLFSDTSVLIYLYHLSKVALPTQGMAYGIATRADVRQLLGQILDSAKEINSATTEAMLNKGVYIKSPYLPYPQQAEFVQGQQFLGSLLGKKRPLTAPEIASLHTNIQTNALGQTIITGFAQVAKSAEVRDYFLRGMEIAKKQIEILGRLLQESDLPCPMTWDIEVSRSTTPPYSDKLMLAHVTALIALGQGNYGLAIAASMRNDVSAAYIRLSAEILAYAEDGANLLIKNGWMEQPPTAVNRRELALSR